MGVGILLTIASYVLPIIAKQVLAKIMPPKPATPTPAPAAPMPAQPNALVSIAHKIAAGLRLTKSEHDLVTSVTKPVEVDSAPGVPFAQL